MKIPALVVKQWLQPEWNEVKYEPAPPRSKPAPHFYLFSISAYTLKKLTGIYRRDPTKPPADDMGIQRRHMPERSDEILRYIQDGFPLSRIDRKKLVDQSDESLLRMPGWLPTAVVVNILTESDQRGSKGNKVLPDNLVKVEHVENNPIAEIEIPENCNSTDWLPPVHPIEVIDGQHRLWALEEPDEKSKKWSPGFKERINKIEIPVVAFYGLDRTWQAYLFYTINQLAKRIDISMVFDLYPLLRHEDWLLRFEGPNIYRETRAQDLTILLWAHPESPWKNRIIRLGGREDGKVSQAAFVRSLLASFIKGWQGGPRSRIGGIYGSLKGVHETFLNWGREQQAAFLILAWQEIRNTVQASEAPWASALIDSHSKAKKLPTTGEIRDILFAGPQTLLASDQGVRGYLCILNDLLWIAHEKKIVKLNEWAWVRKSNLNDEQAVSDAFNELHKQLPDTLVFVQKICTALSSFDWRLSSALSPKDQPIYSRQRSYLGSGGYREIRRNILAHLKKSKLEQPIQGCVNDVIEALNYEVEEEA